MKLLTTDRQADLIAEQKLLIIRQQELAAQLIRTPGREYEARQARAKLILMLNQLELYHAELDAGSECNATTG